MVFCYSSLKGLGHRAMAEHRCTRGSEAGLTSLGLELARFHVCLILFA